MITGEGFLDEQSFEGKVVGGVAELADALGVPVVAVAGQVYDAAPDRIEAVCLVERFGEERARGRHAGVHRGGRRRHPPTARCLTADGPASPGRGPPVPSTSMVERIRRAGTVCWAVCGVAAVIALLGLIAWTCSG